MGQWRGPLFHLTTAQPFSEVLYTNWQVTREQHHWSMMCTRIGFYRSGRIPGSGQIVHSSLPQVLVKWVKVPQLQNACLGHINTHIINVCQYIEGPFNRTEGEKAYNTILVSMVASLKAQSFFLPVWCGKLFFSIKQRPYLPETWRDAPSVAPCHRNITRLHSFLLSGIRVVEGRKEILPKSAICHSAMDAGDKGGRGVRSAHWSSKKLPIELLKQLSDKKEEAHLWLKWEIKKKSMSNSELSWTSNGSIK